MSEEVELTEEQKKEIARNTVGFGLDGEGYIVTKIHSEKGVRDILGFFEQMKDWTKAYFQSKLMEEKQQQQKLVRPDGFLKGFKNKWNVH